MQISTEADSQNQRKNAATNKNCILRKMRKIMQNSILKNRTEGADYRERAVQAKMQP